MTSTQILLEIAGIAAAALGRDLVPVKKSITKTAITKTVTTVKHTARKTVPKRRPAEPFTMYDAVTIANIPAGARAVAGYIDGLYVTVPALRKRFRRPLRLRRVKIATIAVAANRFDADFLDVERYDATPEQAPQWVLVKLKRGDYKPGIYANRATMPRVWALLAAAGISRNQVRLWVADWTGEPHIPTGYDACQWDGGPTARYDTSLCAAGFLR